ncbi:MAG: L-histidine N(alpha)-methyltransferase [Thermodesulfobacteriota bacterium]
MHNNNPDGLDSSGDIDGILNEVIKSLSKDQKELPCKLFYNDKGSELFEEISELDEYYLTRTEISILNDNIEEISEYIGKDVIVVELGSGSSRKIRILLDNLKNIVAYVPVDISKNFLIESAERLAREYNDLRIIPLVADYTRPFTFPEIDLDFNRMVLYYPGSTIGNFDPDKAVKFLKNLSKHFGKKSGLLIGFDLKKDSSIIERAYNDGQGVTASFNLNILNNINNTLGADFDLDKWKHKAFYNKDKGRIEMHLMSLEDQEVRLNGTNINFRKNETIHTENSYKFSVEEFEGLVGNFYSLKNYWTDSSENFAVCFFETK